MDHFIGKKIDRYQVTDLLGKGGMATVYKAFDIRLERYVALKFIRSDILDKQVFFQRFEREAKALARLSHPNIVKILDYGSHEGLPYLVMEFIPGGTLKQWLGQPLPSAEAARLLLPIAKTLDYTHRQNIIHRDVKPANFLITESREPMLSDFGIAKLVEKSDGAPMTSTGAGIGTPEYMSPEQCKGEKVDQRADIYSLGVVLYELVTGTKPYTADTPMAVLMKHITEPLPPPRQFIPNMNPVVENIIRKALAKNPADRYQSMAEFSIALERIINLAHAPAVPNTIKAPPQSATIVQPRDKKLPEPRFNYPAQSSVQAVPESAQQVPQKEKKSRIGLWIGVVIVLAALCLSAAAIVYFASDMLGFQSKAAITSTAQSLAQTIDANQKIRTQEALAFTSTAEAVSAEETASAISAQQTAQAQEQTATAMVEEANRHATSTAEAEEQKATQNALDAIESEFRNAENNWPIVDSEYFETEGDWNTGVYDSEWWTGSKTVVNGRFIWQMEALQGFTHFANDNNIYYSDFLISVDCKQTSGETTGEIGLVLLRNEDDKYYFLINTNTQVYNFYLYTEGEWQTLAAGTDLELYDHTLNTISIMVVNGVFNVFVDGNFVVQVENSQIQEGEIGISASLHGEGETGTFEFDNLIIQVP